MSIALDPARSTGVAGLDWVDNEASPADLAGDFTAHLAAVYFLDPPMDVWEFANAGAVLEEAFGLASLYNYEGVKDYFEPPLVDLFELVDCIGLDGVEEALAWSLSVLEGGTLEPRPSSGVIPVLGDCMGWRDVPSDPVNLASLVFLSIVAAYNKTANIISE
ncbi:MAG: hypothetical protein GSR82_00470 [Desulfurococcales archaeon]|nr:hypothetical protein [Desulfurococcales archaeon]